MRVIAVAVLGVLASPAASAPACGPSRWIMTDEGGRTFTARAYGEGKRDWTPPGAAGALTYTVIALRGESGDATYFITNEYAPHATGGPWSSAKALPKFAWAVAPSR